MLTTIGPSTAAGMPLQRTPNGFLAKRMRPRLPSAVEIHSGNLARAVQGDADAAMKAIAAAVQP